MSQFWKRWKYERGEIALRMRMEFDPWYVLRDLKKFEWMTPLHLEHVDKCNLNAPDAKL